MYRVLQALQATAPVDYSRMRVFSVDELCPPAPPDGYFWRQVRTELLAWAGITAERCCPFAVDAGDLTVMCERYERRIVEAGGLDLVMLGLGPLALLVLAFVRGREELAGGINPIYLAVGIVLAGAALYFPARNWKTAMRNSKCKIQN